MSNPKLEIDHSARSHAMLSASGASRWMNCTPSPRLEEGVESKRNDYADEGTLAHEFAELNLKVQLKIITKSQYNDLVHPFLKHHLYSEDMEEEVQKHIDYVIQQYTAAKRINKDALLLIEEKVDLTRYIEEGYGTNDVIIICDGVLEVIDLKYGKGVRVSAKENPQLKLYALGALEAAELMYDIHTVRLTVTQPRLDSISSWEMDMIDLKAWGTDEVIPKAQMAYEGLGEQVPGDWCRFCKVKSRCRALAELSLQEAKEEFQDPKLLTDEELVEINMKSSMIQDFLSSVSSYMFEEAMKGKKWPEHKLVQGYGRRAWSDQDGAIKILKSKRFKIKEFMSDPKLKGIGDIEKLVGKGNFPVIFAEQVSLSEGNPSLVHESDKRPEYDPNSAADDFGEEDDLS